MLIDATIFVGEINVPNIDSPGVSENLNYFINKYEKKFLTILFGSFVYDKLSVELAKEEGSRDPIFASLINKVDKQSVANFVYKFYMDDQAVLTAGIGVVKPKAENSEKVSSHRKVIRAWNEMSDWVNDSDNIKWFKEWYSVNDFSGFAIECPKRWLEFSKINLLNI